MTLGRKKRNAIIDELNVLSRQKRMLFDRSGDSGRSDIVRNPIRLIEPAANPVANSNPSPQQQPQQQPQPQPSMPASVQDVCDETGCYVNIEEALDYELGDSGRGRWHQTHKMVRLVSCDPKTMGINTNQCKPGQVCCQVYQVFNKHFCMGEPAKAWGAPTNPPPPPIFVSGKAAHLTISKFLLFSFFFLNYKL